MDFWPVLFALPAVSTVKIFPIYAYWHFDLLFTDVAKILGCHISIKPPEAFLSIDYFTSLGIILVDGLENSQILEEATC